jgi:hypothetical protein
VDFDVITPINSFHNLTNVFVGHCRPHTHFAKIAQIPATFGLWSQISKRLAFICIFSLVLGAIADANAASAPKVTCSGNLTNTRENGVTLGNCDLNFITVKEMTEIEDTCGIPGTIDSPAENQCRIRAIVSPDPIPTADHTKLYKVIEVWSVDKR